MEYTCSIQKTIDYIEEHLKTDMTNRQIADAIGYSEYHFLRIFRDCTHLTPANYIRKRRITEIVRRMAEDTRPISDIAFEYGFNSKENFIRAFKAEHGILPTEFKRSQNSLKLYDQITFDLPESEIPCRIMQIEPFTLIAYPSDTNTPPDFWNRYNVKGYSKKLSGGSVVTDYGVCIWNAEKKKLDYWIGIRETDAKGDRSGSVELSVGGGLYAVFKTPAATRFDFVNNIHRTWNYINTVWLPNSAYIRTGGYELEYYQEESRTFSETILIPVRKKPKGDV